MKDQENMPFKATWVFTGVEIGTGRFTTVRDEHISTAANRIAAVFFHNDQLESFLVTNKPAHRTLGRTYQAYKRDAETGQLEPIGGRFYVRQP